LVDVPSSEAETGSEKSDKSIGRNEAAQARDLAPVFGALIGLINESPQHSGMYLNGLDWLVVPPILHGQYRLFRRYGTPTTFASWAYLGKKLKRH
jgi:hemolysin-activating ACP:hemolysin acyltransferase